MKYLNKQSMQEYNSIILGDVTFNKNEHGNWVLTPDMMHEAIISCFELSSYEGVNIKSVFK